MFSISTVIYKYTEKFAQNKDITEIISGALISILLKVLGMGLTYAFLFILSNKYGPEAVGVFSIYQSSLILCTIIATFGFDSAILRFAAQYSTKERWGLLFDIYRRMSSIIVIVGLIMASGIYGFADKLATLFLHDAARSFVFKSIAIALPFSAIASLNAEAIRGLKNIGSSEYIRTVNTNLFNVLLFILATVVFGFYVEMPTLTYSLALFCTFLISTVYWFVRVDGNVGSGRKRGTDPSSKKEILQVALPLLLATLLQQLMAYLAIFLLGIFRSSSDVGIYSAALRMASITSFILLAINTIVGPKFAELYWSNRIDDLKRVVRFSSSLIFWISTPVLMVLIIFPGGIMGLFGPEFVRGKWILVILSIGQFVNALSGSVTYFLSMTGGHNVIKNVMLVAALLNIILNLILIKPFGITGAALSTAASIIFWNITSVIYIRSRHSINTFYLPGL